MRNYVVLARSDAISTVLAGLLLLSLSLGGNYAWADEGCTNRTWDGTYVVSINGFRTTQPPQLIGAFSPVAVIGTFTFDGTGNVSRSITVSNGGQDFPVSDVGTYSVNPDCTGSVFFPDIGESFGLTTVERKTISMVTATQGESGAGTLMRQQVHACSQDQLQGAFAFSLNGWGSFQAPPLLVDGFFPVAVSGTWVLDGNGSVTRNLNLSFFGSVFPYQDAGAYQVNADCTASAYFPNDNEPFAIVFVDRNKLVTNALSVPGVSRVGAATLTKQRLNE